MAKELSNDYVICLKGSGSSPTLTTAVIIYSKADGDLSGEGTTEVTVGDIPSAVSDWFDAQVAATKTAEGIS